MCHWSCGTTPLPSPRRNTAIKSLHRDEPPWDRDPRAEEWGGRPRIAHNQTGHPAVEIGDAGLPRVPTRTLSGPTTAVSTLSGDRWTRAAHRWPVLLPLGFVVVFVVACVLDAGALLEAARGHGFATALAMCTTLPYGTAVGRREGAGAGHILPPSNPRHNSVSFATSPALAATPLCAKATVVHDCAPCSDWMHGRKAPAAHTPAKPVRRDLAQSVLPVV